MYCQKTLGLLINTFEQDEVNLVSMIAPEFSPVVKACRPRILRPCLNSYVSLIHVQYEGNRFPCIQSKYYCMTPETDTISLSKTEGMVILPKKTSNFSDNKKYMK